MSLSIRTQILNNLKTLIEDIDFSETVKIMFCTPDDLDIKQIPAITIEVINENIDYTTIGYPREQQRTLNVDVSIVVKSRVDLFIKAEEFTTLIEEKISETRNNVKLNSLNSVVLNCEISSLEYRDYNDLLENTGGYTLTFTITYNCKENNLRQVI